MALIYTNQSSGRKKRRVKSAGVRAAEAELEATLRRVGYKGTKKVARPLERSSTSVSDVIKTSDQVPGNGNKRYQNKYTGTEIAGVTLLHKQAYEPVRRDNKKAAVQAAQMRRN